MEDEERAKPRAYKADPERLRRETRAESPIGASIEKAAADADNRALRQRGFPPPSEAEQELIAASLHEPVQLFVHVLVADLEDGEPERFQLVPHDEADLAGGKISIASPLGRALYQEYPGSVVTVKAPAGPRLMRILQVHP